MAREIRLSLRPRAREAAEAELALVDADVARYYVDDGQLSERPLDGAPTEHGLELRERRIAAVTRLRVAGGSDPHPSFLLEPTEAQRAARLARRAEYDRDVLVEVLVYHWPTSTSGCGCGWSELGASYPEHVADVYEASVAARATVAAE